MHPLDPATLERLASLELRARAIVEGALSGLHRSHRFGSSVEFADHKEYAAGDEIKRIDWKAYGKFDKYYIKRFEEETELSCYLVVDTSASMGYAGAGVSKLDYARLLAAALAYLLLRQQDQVGLVAFAAGLSGFVPARARRGHLRDLFTALDALEARGRTDLVAAVGYLSEVMRRRSLVILFSDLLGSDEKLRHLLRGLRARRHEVVVFHTLDGDELTLPFSQPTLFESMEDDARLLADPADVRQAYLAELTRFIDDQRRGLGQGDIGYQLVDTRRPPGELLFEFLTGSYNQRGGR